VLYDRAGGYGAAFVVAGCAMVAGVLSIWRA